MPTRPAATSDVVDVRRRAWRAIMEAHGTITSLLDAELRDATGMGLQTYDALLHVFEAGESGIRMTDLAREVVLSKAGLTALVDRLEQLGLLRRTPDRQDRRATRITLTAAGLDAFREAAKVHVAGIEAHFTSRLSDDEACVIAETLERIRHEQLP